MNTKQTGRSTFRPGLVNLLDKLYQHSLSEGELSDICHSLSLMLTHACSMLGDKTGMRNWSVDSLQAEKFSVLPNKMTLQGNIHWKEGGGAFKTYKANIVTNTSPLSCSFTFLDSNSEQQVFLSKSFDRWTVQKLLRSSNVIQSN